VAGEQEVSAMATAPKAIINLGSRFICYLLEVFWYQKLFP
jgi:hypothetical protein